VTPYPHFDGGIWAVDFEFHPAHGHEGNHPTPVCMVARELVTGEILRFWQDELQKMARAPFPTGANALFVAYYASAEFSFFLALGWPMPANTLDLFTEFRCLTNGLHPAQGVGLLGALFHYGLPGIGGEEKNAMRDLVLRRGPWAADEQTSILDYCESDVLSLASLFPVMKPQIDWPRALLRGRYMQSVAHMEFHGVPMDTTLHAKLNENWLRIQGQLISSIDQEFNVYEGHSFKAAKFETYLAARGMSWPRLPSGSLDLKDDTFKDMARSYPQIAALKELRVSLAAMRLSELPVGTDGRNRCMLSPFRSKTGRNQPSNARNIFGPSVWMRGLIRPAPGYALAYLDWSQQEFGIAAALSQDAAMMIAYSSGDPYLAFAKQAGAVPANATKASSSRHVCWRCSTAWAPRAWRCGSTDRWCAPGSCSTFTTAHIRISGPFPITF
jgi:DNA polymerase-1